MPRGPTEEHTVYQAYTGTFNKDTSSSYKLASVREATQQETWPLHLPCLSKLKPCLEE